MSSPPEGKLETKAGHPPAVKAGGMRIVQKHPHSGDTKEERDKDDQEWESPSPPYPTVFLSGSAFCLGLVLRETVTLSEPDRCGAREIGLVLLPATPSKNWPSSLIGMCVYITNSNPKSTYKV
ncbi:death-associated protein 1 isoform X1 [Phyllostomus discolor]|uniref:Death-associated protein 1 isoform X1 n=1 Tax=Phyllostomus discolor TaxID=89673 RepID=A0A7E6DCY5_9CHIR|nr:death-associated protein 1 isoform X1 [Phyllostomus discolor]